MSGDFIFREVVGVKFVIQRVLHASVTIDGVRIAQIGKGFLVLVGIGREDTAADADRLADKLVKLRIFEDESGKTNRSLSDVNGSLLLVSQFTLYADCRKGNRPSFGAAGAPEDASRLFDYITARCREAVPDTQPGRFGAEMQVESLNAGPFTLILE